MRLHKDKQIQQTRELVQTLPLLGNAIVMRAVNLRLEKNVLKGIAQPTLKGEQLPLTGL